MKPTLMLDPDFLSGTPGEIINRLHKLKYEWGPQTRIELITEDMGFYQPHYIIRVEVYAEYEQKRTG